MQSFFKSFYRIDLVMVALVLILLLIGLASIYSVDLSRGDGLFLNFKKQLIAASLGLFLLVVLGSANYRFLESYVTPLYLFTNLLLFGVIIFGQNVRGTTGWFSFGGFNFQPIEFAKIGIILSLAKYFESHPSSRFTMKSIWQTLIIVGIPISLIFLQPDFGGAVIIFAVWFLLLLIFGIKKSHIIIFSISAVLLLLISWFALLAPYQKDRVESFFDPGRDPTGAGYNVRQSIIAIGAGRFFGRGLGFGSQSQLKFLPESQTDFIFAVIAEELGFIMTAVILLFYAALLYRFLRVARLARDNFSVFLALGITFLFALEFFVNVGMNLGIMPIMGIALPFLSYGGSSLVMHLAAVGIMLSAARST